MVEQVKNIYAKKQESLFSTAEPDATIDSGCIVMHNCITHTLNFISLSNNSTYYAVSGPSNKGIKFGLSFHNTRLCKIPGTSYMVAASWFDSEGLDVLDLIQLQSKEYALDQSKQKYIFPSLVDSIKNENTGSHICDIALNEKRGLLAMFAQTGKFTYQLWNLKMQSIWTRLHFLKKSKWTLYDSNLNSISSSVESLAFNKPGLRIASLYFNKDLQIADVDTNKVYLKIKIADDNEQKLTTNTIGQCKWIPNESEDANIITLIKNRPNLHITDPIKSETQFVTLPKSKLQAFDLHPINNNLIAIGTIEGNLIQYDLREKISDSKVLLDEPYMELSSNREYQKVEWNVANPEQILFHRGSDIYLVDTRQTLKSRVSIFTQGYDVCYV